MQNIIEQWNQAAVHYAEDQDRSPFAQSNRRIVRQRFRDLTGARVLDLGCGHGAYTGYFRSIGAEVTGVDGAEAMLAIARERCPDCTFLQCDITRPLPFADAQFSLVFCNQVLMDIESVPAVLAECRRVLHSGGVLYISIVHPAFYNSPWLKDESGTAYAKAVSGYLQPHTVTNRFWGETAHFHRPLSYYLNAAADHGFRLVRTDEPAAYDPATNTADLPLFFFAEFSKE